MIMIKSHSRGWEIYFDGNDWRYSDKGKLLDDSRPCKRCGRMPTKEGYDACLGYIRAQSPLVVVMELKSLFVESCK